mmetsp:Transcript_6267/g.11846  ORF Transcript_6267/g.11846 Transcript_6267/m.11846 type:complete len:378 (-) Transcript_6267:334-1467(-)|eukprot:CAMPEP_0176483952 /NCGR_PEP_ID=MMETSP0200_2-20121128/4194_1 /TAXON_ID=947934 /ORGANISM="Chaetoceros sp., Strain GSL56" /LENGTH=377 /DNA_ID=CAMNT_0017880391 /DNA_START=437 /DNA_END=1570 /DNA_ORIENTATION=+
MSRLNATIKLVVLLGDAIFLILAIGLIILSGMANSGKITELNFDLAKRLASVVLLASIVLLSMTIYGCCGSLNQTVRNGFCSGRRSLCFHQLILIVILIVSIVQTSSLERRETSVKMVIDNQEQFTSYDSFETQLDAFFNREYFDRTCPDTEQSQGAVSGGGNHLVMQWVDDYCPDIMRSQECLNMACTYITKADDKTTNLLCPNQNQCINQGLTESCPYYQCRIPILGKVKDILSPTLLILRSLSILSGIMVTFTCLLICYNPRDDIEIELLKTGVMTEEDVENIRRLKRSCSSGSSSRKFSYEKGTRDSKYRTHSINLDALHQQQAQGMDATRSVGDGGGSGSYYYGRRNGSSISRNKNKRKIHPTVAKARISPA